MSEGVFRNPFDVIDEDDGDEDELTIVSLPQEIEQAFKKIVKRDSTTRSKGFNELLETLKSYTDAEIKIISNLMKNSFVKIFEKFAICSEKSSRMSVAELTSILISKSDSKTFLKPILKEILTTWLLSLFDPVNEISALQRKTLESVFPAGTKLKLLLEKFDQKIWTELLEFTVSDKFERLKEITVNEMEGTAEEASNVVELVKTEIIGLMTLLSTTTPSHPEAEIKSLLFLKDKEIASTRRAALYRFNVKFQAAWLVQFCKSLILKETNPSALVAAIDLVEKVEFGVLEDEMFILNVLCFAPVGDFKRFARLLKFIDGLIVTICRGNLMNKDRFLAFWKDIVICNIDKCDDKNKRIKIIENLLFPQSKRLNNSLVVFSPLNAEESMNCVLEAFNPDELLTVCKERACPQSIFALSMLKSEECASILENLINQLNISDLQSKELMKVLPEDIVTRKLSDRIDEMSSSEIIRLIQNLSDEKAVEMLKDCDVEFWTNFMTRTTLLTRKIIKNVLLNIEGFRQYAREHLENVLILSCAFESEISIYDPEMIANPEIFVEAFKEVEQVELCSPTLKIALKNHLLIEKIKGLPVDKRKLYEFIEIEKDVELFEALECEDEDFYPIGFVEEEMAGENVPVDPIEILLYKPKSRQLLPMWSLLNFPLKKFENQRKVVKCAFIYDLIDFIDFKISVKEFVKVSDNFELYCLSKVLEEGDFDVLVVVDVALQGFKDSLLLYRSLSTGEPNRINQILGEIIFDEERNLKSDLLSFSCTIEPVLPVRSDNLAGLIGKLLQENQVDALLLLISKHLEREDLKKEFWQVQFKENIKGILVYDGKDKEIRRELKLRISAGIWNKLTDPEIEILEDCNFKEPLSSTNIERSQFCFEEYGLARLVLMAAPFMKESFEIEKLIQFYDSNSIISPSLELAYRSVYLQLHLDEKLVAASVLIDPEMEGELDDKIQIIFPFYKKLLESSQDNRQKFAILLEMFVSAAEGSREDWKLMGIFADALKLRILPILKEMQEIDGTLESFDFTPRDFDAEDLLKHVIHRLCALFPLLIRQGIPRDIYETSQMILEQREIERIRRQPTIIIESVEICLKPIITSTTKLINIRVKFADEITLVIDLILPRAFPLEPIRVEGRDKSGLSESKWKAALLSLQTLLRSVTFSGNVVEVIKKWQANVMKLFQGLEECAVCYCVLHPSDKSLPGPACKQCKHKFHATCLYKWFKSSGNATCPLCRALF